MTFSQSTELDYSAARIHALQRSIALAQRSDASTTLSCRSSWIALAFFAIESTSVQSRSRTPRIALGRNGRDPLAQRRLRGLSGRSMEGQRQPVGGVDCRHEPANVVSALLEPFAGIVVSFLLRRQQSAWWRTGAF